MNKILKGISWVFVGNIIAAFSKWLILIFIARILTPSDVGIYSLAFAFTAPIALFSNLKLRSLIITDRNLHFTDYLQTRNLMSLITLMIIIALGMIAYPEHLLIITLVGLNKIYDLHSELFYSIPHLHSKFDYIGKLMIVKHLLLIIFFGIALYYSRNLILSLIIQFLVQIVVFYLLEKRIIENKFSIKYDNINFTNIKNIIMLGIPLGISMMFVSLNSNFPRYILEYFQSEEILGYFSAIAYIVTVGNLLMRSVTQYFLPRLTNLFNNNQINKFKTYIFGYLTIFSLVLGGVIILMSYFLGEFLLTIIYGQEYAEYIGVLIIMSYALTINFVSWNFDTALMSMRYISIQPKISLITLILSIGVGIILVGSYGIYGAAYTIAVTFIFQLILRAIFVIYGLKKLASN